MVENPVDPALYARVVDAFPQAVVEDAALTPETQAALGPALERLSFDAPVHSWADVAGLPRTPRFLNVKPSRFGTVAGLFEFLERAAAAGIALYGGGQFELGPGRAQIQALASLFYPNAPNDVAPSGYNEPEPRAGLQGSPLPVPARLLGFDFSGAPDPVRLPATRSAARPVAGHAGPPAGRPEGAACVAACRLPLGRASRGRGVLVNGTLSREAPGVR